jgi:DNA-binding transcriptional LysR family regulator
MRTARREYGNIGTVNLFMAVPAGLAMLIGQMLNTFAQPALSRRIRALEDWVGTALVDRDTHQIGLTPAGERFRPIADEILRRLHLGQEEAREAADAASSTLRFAATHALALTFFPVWLRQLEANAAARIGQSDRG